MIYFHVRTWSNSTLHLGIMHRDGSCYVFDSFDENYNPLSVRQEHIFNLILDKQVGSIEFGTDSVEKYIDMFPDIKEDYEQCSTNAERDLYIQLALARLPSSPYEMKLLVDVFNSKKNQIRVSEDDFYEMGDYRELENLGYVSSEKVTTHAYNEDYYFSLTHAGTKLVEEHLNEVALCASEKSAQ